MLVLIIGYTFPVYVKLHFFWLITYAANFSYGL